MKIVPMFFAFSLILVVAGSGPSDAFQLKEGLWSMKSKQEGVMGGRGRDSESKECIGPGETMNPKRFMQEMSHCTMSDVVSETQKMSWKMSCQSPAGPMTGVGVLRLPLIQLCKRNSPKPSMWSECKCVNNAASTLPRGMRVSSASTIGICPISGLK